MRTFLSVAQGTHEPAKFLEVYVLCLRPPIPASRQRVPGSFPRVAVLSPFNRHYKGLGQPNARPLAFVGKGITFDSGGISLKPSAVCPPLPSPLAGPCQY